MGSYIYIYLRMWKVLIHYFGDEHGLFIEKIGVPTQASSSPAMLCQCAFPSTMTWRKLYDRWEGTSVSMHYSFLCGCQIGCILLASNSRGPVSLDTLDIHRAGPADISPPPGAFACWALSLNTLKANLLLSQNVDGWVLVLLGFVTCTSARYKLHSDRELVPHSSLSTHQT